ncbi:acyltransferase-domain-containing protein [Gongronella butleri]|nr:acyltransferase-domain-containing protein [Gongronella butleri]
MPSSIVNFVCVNFGLFYQSVCVVFGQTLGLPLYFFAEPVFRQYIAMTQRVWSQCLMAVVQFFAPSTFVLTLDPTVTDDPAVVEPKDSGFQLHMPDRMIVIGNHQIYADWVYIWALAFLARAHGSIKIVVKSSLKYLPWYGWGMQYFDFIFLKRRLADDQLHLKENLTRSKKNGRPLWLVLFPEGTVVSDNTRQRSKAYAEKMNLEDLTYTLLPRSTGLRLAMETLDTSVEWVYDLTICYPDIKKGDNPESIYTLPGVFFFNQYPRKIHMYVRRFRIKDLPVHDEARFSNWLHERWVEKDMIMAAFYRDGHFPKACGTPISTPIKLDNPLWQLIQPTLFVVPYLIALIGICTLYLVK